MAIAYAVLHRLATHTGCIGFFATHFTSLTEDFAVSPLPSNLDERFLTGSSVQYHPEYAHRLPGVGPVPDRTLLARRIRLANMQTSVNDETREVVFLYKLVHQAFLSLEQLLADSRCSQIDGSSPKSYGPHVAAMAGLSECVKRRSLSVRTSLMSTARSIVERAIAISKQFEETSRARELAMRANETLPLTAQADAAFLIKLAKLKLADGKYTGDKKQLLRTLDVVRKAVGAIKQTRAAA